MSSLAEGKGLVEFEEHMESMNKRGEVRCFLGEDGTLYNGERCRAGMIDRYGLNVWVR